MKKLFFITFASLIALSGCGAEENELLNAIDNSYDLDTGQIQSKFDYTTEYNNIDIEGTVSGLITIDFGNDLDKITANINFEGSEDQFEYYVDSKGNIISNTESTEVDYAPLYIDAPNLSDFAEEIPEPKASTFKTEDGEIDVNVYTFEFTELSTDIAKSLFDPIIKLGFVSTEVLQRETIEGNFKLNYYVDIETGKLVAETLDYSNKTTDNLTTKTEIHIENTYSYEENIVELPQSESETESEMSEA